MTMMIKRKILFGIILFFQLTFRFSRLQTFLKLQIVIRLLSETKSNLRETLRAADRIEYLTVYEFKIRKRHKQIEKNRENIHTSYVFVFTE